MPFAKKDIVLDAGIIITISAVFLLFIGFFLHIITAQAIGINEPMIEAITSFVLAKLFERCMIFGALLLIIGITIIITGVVIMKKKSVKEAKELEKK